MNGQDGAKWPTNGAHLAMTRRVLKYVNAVQEAHQLQQTRNAATMVPGTSNPLSAQTRQEQHMRMLGNDPSALALAAALDCAKDASVLDVKKKLAGKGFADMPYHLVADSAAFRLLTAHGKQAEKSGCKKFLYVDLTANEWLPAHVTIESVGGKSNMGDEPVFQDASVSSLSQLHQALRSAFTTKKVVQIPNAVGGSLDPDVHANGCGV